MEDRNDDRSPSRMHSLPPPPESHISVIFSSRVSGEDVDGKPQSPDSEQGDNQDRSVVEVVVQIQDCPVLGHEEQGPEAVHVSVVFQKLTQDVGYS
mmetsp:Transcript_17716/g.15632  ORF Transcript_17716/g.15632 Transcript_17716/m.15632 type:complete len:96 (+) Transcript_17716:218-505(+)